ncbi:alkaline phosphatase family protein [Hymenobacter ginsengisoli]|uniref:Alkaline phosphatase family protein n=1 Tax=Hymenobacter ginsengisoli TaxID=1051626 RepID=A0ABP8QHK6_9BACT|nr:MULTISPECIES: alkaline phosphatase family protein [unclassified Hymenobacter]MBO2029981.1 alkaline phosphatase family protein [Hymenobacter sp. BT559]
MLNRLLLLAAGLLASEPALLAQNRPAPKLLVGIMVDQMRPDYLTRFANDFGPDGFNRLRREGMECRNTHYNYIPTVTGPGHSSVYTGTTPRYHGIVGNSWYDRRLRRDVYCTDDTTVQLVGPASKGLGVSARNQVSTTLGDELKMTYGGRSRVLALSLKDRASALPAGHMADGAFWFDTGTGSFISSTYYVPRLPAWVESFNAQKKADYYRTQTWTPLRGPEAYRNSLPDSNRYERIFKGKTAATFPYDLAKLAPLNPPAYEGIYTSPFGNSLLTDLALSALASTDLGRDDVPDLLAISYSSPDAVGHTFGPLSKEENDLYLRLDLELARLLQALDKTVGKGNYAIFLTADHGASEVTRYLADHQLPVGTFDRRAVYQAASAYLTAQLGPGQWLETERNNTYYFNRPLLAQHKIELAHAQQVLAEFVRDQPGIAQVNTTTQLLDAGYTTGLEAKLQLGLYYPRFGDVRYELMPGWTGDIGVGASHGTGYAYDSHVPLLWWGPGIPAGVSYAPHTITDIAPTAAMLLNSKLPSACIGQPIVEVLGGPAPATKPKRP